MRYNIEFTDNTGNRAAIAIAETVEGSVISNTPRFDGTNDLAIIECPEKNASYLEEVLNADENVVAYS